MPPDKLDYARPVPTSRTTGRMLADAFVGLAQVGVGLIGCVIAVVLTESTWGPARPCDVPDEPFDRVRAGVRRIWRGRIEIPKREGAFPANDAFP